MFPILFLSMAMAVFAYETPQCTCGVNKPVPNFSFKQFKGDWYVWKATEGYYQEGVKCVSFQVYEEENHVYAKQQMKNGNNQLGSIKGEIMNTYDKNRCWQVHYDGESVDTAMIVTNTDYENYAVIYEYLYDPDLDSCDENTIILSRKKEFSYCILNILGLIKIDFSDLIDLDSSDTDSSYAMNENYI